MESDPEVVVGGDEPVHSMLRLLLLLTMSLLYREMAYVYHFDCGPNA